LFENKIWQGAVSSSCHLSCRRSSGDRLNHDELVIAISTGGLPRLIYATICETAVLTWTNRGIGCTNPASRRQYLFLRPTPTLLLRHPRLARLARLRLPDGVRPVGENHVAIVTAHSGGDIDPGLITREPAPSCRPERGSSRPDHPIAFVCWQLYKLLHGHNPPSWPSHCCLLA